MGTEAGETQPMPREAWSPRGWRRWDGSPWSR